MSSGWQGGSTSAARGGERAIRTVLTESKWDERTE